MTLQQQQPVADNYADNDWTHCLIGRLKKHLATVEIDSSNDYKDNLGDKRVFDYLESRKYYNRAHHFLKIGAFKPPVPKFVVSLSDLTPRIIKELYQLDEQDRKLVLKQSVGRILRYKFRPISF